MRKALWAISACVAVCSSPLAAVHAEEVDAPCAPNTRQADQRVLQRFAALLLHQKRPRQAYERYASAQMIERSKAFGANRESTIAQWQTMTKRADSRFDIQSIQLLNDVGVIRFHGQLQPKRSGAEVTLYLRLRCGLITEEWDHFNVGK